MSPPIHPLTSSQGAVFLINSCQRNFRCGPHCCGQALSRSYGCFFAEFLEDHSPVRLGLLDLITCVGLRYGFIYIKLRSFSRRFAPLSLTRRTESLRHIWSLTLKSVFRICLEYKMRHAYRKPLICIEYYSPSLHRIYMK